MAGYTKLFHSILTSTIWREKDHVRLVWIAMLAASDQYGVIEASVPGLADLARVSRADCEDALRVLAAPDPDSRTKVAEGRRIEPVDGGWKLINHRKFREKMKEEDRKNKRAAYMRDYRSRNSESNQNVTGRDSTVPPVTKSGPSDQLQTQTRPDQKSPSGTTESPPTPRKRGERAWRRIPEAWAPNEGHRKLAAELDVSLELELAKIRDFEFAKPRLDPDATFRTWLRTAAERQQRSRPYQGGNSAAENTKRAVERARRLTAEFEARQAASGET